MADALVLEDPDALCVQRTIGRAYLEHLPKDLPEESAPFLPPRTRFSAFKGFVAGALGIVVKKANIGPHEIHYWDTGGNGKPPAVLIHGFTAAKENWVNVVPLLRGRFRLLVPDVPGFGQNNFLPVESYSLYEQAGRLHAWYRELGLGPAHWAGSSMGGAIAGIVAALNPDCVQSLVLMNSAGIAPPRLSAFEEALTRGECGLIATSYCEVLEALRRTVERRKGFISQFYAPLIAHDQILRAPLYRRLFREMLKESSSRSYEWATVAKAPALIVWGDQDRILSPSAAQIFHRLIPGSKVAMLEDVGHLPMLEVPFTMARLCSEFWLSHARAATSAPAPAARN